MLQATAVVGGKLRVSCGPLIPQFNLMHIQEKKGKQTCFSRKIKYSGWIKVSSVKLEESPIQYYSDCSDKVRPQSCWGRKAERQRRNNTPLSSGVHSMRPCLCTKHEGGWDHITELPEFCFIHPNLAVLAFATTLGYIGLIFKGNKHLQLPLTLVTAAVLKSI